MKLSIVVPCYNEEKNIPLILEKFNKVIKRNDIEVILVNNGSTDNSDEVLKDLLQNHENYFAHLVSIKNNIGYGHGIIQGFNKANGEVYAWTHADLQTDPLDVILAFEKYSESLINNSCIVKGNRINRNFFDEFFTFGMSVVSTLLLRKRLFDVNAQPKIFNKKFYDNLLNPPNDFSLDLFLLYEAQNQGLVINTFPVTFHKRYAGISKGGGSIKGKIKLIMRTFKYIISLRKELLKNE